MTISQEPQLQVGLENQTSIQLQLFSLALNTTINTRELERTWEGLTQQEEISDQQQNQRQHK